MESLRIGVLGSVLSRVRSMAVQGIEAYEVTVEVDVARGLPAFNIVGLGDRIVNEAKERVRAAIRNSGLDFPLERITVNLLPSGVPKEGCGFDLPIATGILASTRQIPPAELPDLIILGGLGLDGTVWDIEGALVLASGAEGTLLVMPQANASEALNVRQAKLVCPPTLVSLVNHLRKQERLPVLCHKDACGAREMHGTRISHLPGGDGRRGNLSSVPGKEQESPSTPFSSDMAEVVGHHAAKRALEVAAAGFHSILMSGPPGTGKTMLARRLPGIMPDLTYDESLDVSKVWSISGMYKGELIFWPPFRSPHHSITMAGMIGGGRHPRPGEVSLAHGGILFCDELPLFRREVLEALRQPMEDGEVNVSRTGAKATFPSWFMLVGAQNPCLCGYRRLDGSGDCRCSPSQIRRYQSRVPNPILDRIDMFIEFDKMDWQASKEVSPGIEETSLAIKERSISARNIQRERFGVPGSERKWRILANGSMTFSEAKKFMSLTKEAHRCLDVAALRMGLGMRGFLRAMRVSRTVADLECDSLVRSHHVEEALSYREAKPVDAAVYAQWHLGGMR